MDTIRFRVQHADGRIEELVTESSQVLVGSGRHCEIRLPVDQARVEHVLIQVAPAGLRATARAFDPPPKLDEVEFTQAPVRADAVLAIGKTRITISAAASIEGRAHVLRAGAKRNPRVYAYLVLGLAGCIAMVVARGRHGSGLNEPAKVPALFETSAVRCPETAERADAVAQDRMSLAVAKQERSPFHPEDGVEAVPLYLTAESCFRASGDVGDADEAAANAERLKKQMTEEFRFHRVRLQRSIALQRWNVAEREAGLLLSFLTRGGEYATWLSNLRRKILLTYISKKER
ncbi:MAG TPA: hypothetical protein VGM06_12330 [Polyangiaceae bacterium]|jgi:hypothetical protein